MPSGVSHGRCGGRFRQCCLRAAGKGDRRRRYPTLWQGEQGGHARLLAGTSGPDMVELWQWSLYPGEIFTSPGHGEGTTELLFVTEGALTLTVNDSLYLIPAGDSAVARTDAPHSYANAGETVTRFTMTVSEKAR